MRALILLWLSLTVSGAGISQDLASADALIASREAEVRQLALLYGIHLDRVRSVHQPVSICPAFSHHVFARYDLQYDTGTTASFIAVYTLDKPPATSLNKPWQGGIVLLPYFGRTGSKMAVGPPGTITVFNRVWADELQRSGQPSAFPGLTWSGLAYCYLTLANEQPLRPWESEQPGQNGPAFIDLRSQTINSILVPLTSTGSGSRTAIIDFDKNGLVSGASLSVSAVPVLAPSK